MMADFLAFLEAMRGRRLLHLGHKDADCDALGSAYALSCLLPGDVGFVHGLKTSARDLAEWIGLKFLIDQDPAAYEYTIIYDTVTPSLLGIPVPSRYALFDHHEPGNRRYASSHSELANGAEWAWVRPVESTCSLLVDLFQAHAVTIDRKVATALAAGIVTDTSWLRTADAPALRRLATVLESAGLYVEDVLAVIDSPSRRAARRSAMLNAVRGMHERVSGGWSILATETDSHDHGFAALEVLNHLGGDVSVVSFPKGNQAMVMVTCGGVVVERAGIDLAGLMGEVAQAVKAKDTWGSRAHGRIIAPISERRLMDLCVDVIAAALAPVPPSARY